MKTDFASDLDELKNWVEGVRQLPFFLRTKAARELFDALGAAGIANGADLDGKDIDEVAARVGKNKDALMASLRKCPFGIG